MKRNFIKAAIVLSLLVLAVMAFASCSHEHLFTEMNVLQAATCTEEGSIEYTCECGYVKKATIDVAEHVAGPWEVTRQATCNTKGSRSQACKNCGFTLDVESIPTTDHDIVKVEAKTPTCSEVGYSAYEYCALCTYTTYSEIEKKDHTPGAAATCTTPQFCRVCETEVSEALGHVRVVKAGKEATCKDEGLTDLVECSRCKKVIEEQITIPKRVHAVTTIKGYAATCAETGYSDELVCLVCDEVIVEKVKLPVNNDHDYSSRGKCTLCGYDREDKCEHEDEDGKTYLKPLNEKSTSCTKYGLEEGEYCDNCHWITVEQELAGPEEHNIQITEGYPASFMKPGLTDGEYCKTCRTVIRQQEVIPVLTHDSASESRPEVINGGELAYKTNPGSNTCTITGIGTCTSDTIVIPEYIDDYRVTAIAADAFYSNATLKSVTVGSNVYSIGEKAFAGCLALKEVKLSDGIEVHKDAFLGSTIAEIEYTHVLVYVDGIEATCEVPGRLAHYICVNCSNRYENKDAEKQVYNIQLKIEHEFKGDSENCANCRKNMDDVLIVVAQLPSKIKDKTVSEGTSVKDLDLPTTMTVETYDEEEHTLNIVWDTSKYNPNEYGRYEITGYILTGGYQIAKSLANSFSDVVKIYISVV